MIKRGPTDGASGRKERTMLFLQLKSGEYLTIGEDIAIQVFPDSANNVRVAVKAPRDLTILRGEVRERGGAKRPEGLVGPTVTNPSVSSG